MRSDPSRPGSLSLSIDPSKSARKDEFKRQWRKLEAPEPVNAHVNKASSPTKKKRSPEKGLQKQSAVLSRNAHVTKSTSPSKTKRTTSDKQRHDSKKVRTSPTKTKGTKEKQRQGTSDLKFTNANAKKSSNPTKKARSVENQRPATGAGRSGNTHVKPTRILEKQRQGRGATKTRPSNQKLELKKSTQRHQDIQVVESRNAPEVHNGGRGLRESREGGPPLIYVIDENHWNAKNVSSGNDVCQENCIEDFSITDQNLIKVAIGSIEEKASNKTDVKDSTLRSIELKKLVSEGSNTFKKYVDHAATGINEMIALGRNGCNAKDLMECLTEWDGNTSYGSFTNDSDVVESESQSTAVHGIALPAGNDEGNKVESHSNGVPKSSSSTSDNDTIVTESPSKSSCKKLSSVVSGSSDHRLESYFSPPIGCADLLPVESDSFSVLSPGSKTVNSVASNASNNGPSSRRESGSTGILPVGSSTSSVVSGTSHLSNLLPAGSDDEELMQMQETIQDVQHFEVQLSTSSLSRFDDKSVTTDKDNVGERKKASGLKTLLTRTKEEDVESKSLLNIQSDNRNPINEGTENYDLDAQDPWDQLLSNESLGNESVDVNCSTNHDDLASLQAALEEKIVQLKEDETSHSSFKDKVDDESKGIDSSTSKDPSAVQDSKEMQGDTLSDKVECDETQEVESIPGPNDDTASISTHELRSAERKAFAISLTPLKGIKSCNSYLSTSESCSDASCESLELKKNEAFPTGVKKIGKSNIHDDATYKIQPKESTSTPDSEKKENTDYRVKHLHDNTSVKHRLPKQSSVLKPPASQYFQHFDEDSFMKNKSSATITPNPQVIEDDLPQISNKRSKISLIKNLFRKSKQKRHSQK